MAYIIRKKVPYILGIGLLRYKQAESDIFKEETGRDRLRKMFTYNEFREPSVELYSVMQMSAVSFVTSFIYSGYKSTKKSVHEFIANNEATKFVSQYDASRTVNNVGILQFFKGGFKFSLRFTIFSTTFALIATMISVYRGDIKPWDYAIGAGIAGALYKTFLGPAAMLIAGLVSSLLGLIIGYFTVLLLRSSGMTMKEFRYKQYGWKEHRNNILRKAVRKEQNENEMKEIITFHDQLIKEKDAGLDDIE